MKCVLVALLLTVAVYYSYAQTLYGINSEACFGIFNTSTGAFRTIQCYPGLFANYEPSSVAADKKNEVFYVVVGPNALGINIHDGRIVANITFSNHKIDASRYDPRSQTFLAKEYYGSATVVTHYDVSATTAGTHRYLIRRGPNPKNECYLSCRLSAGFNTALRIYYIPQSLTYLSFNLFQNTYTSTPFSYNDTIAPLAEINNLKWHSKLNRLISVCAFNIPNSDKKTPDICLINPTTGQVERKRVIPQGLFEVYLSSTVDQENKFFYIISLDSIFGATYLLHTVNVDSWTMTSINLEGPAYDAIVFPSVVETWQLITDPVGDGVTIDSSEATSHSSTHSPELSSPSASSVFSLSESMMSSSSSGGGHGGAIVVIVIIIVIVVVATIGALYWAKKNGKLVGIFGSDPTGPIN